MFEFINDEVSSGARKVGFLGDVLDGVGAEFKGGLVDGRFLGGEAGDSCQII